MKGLIYILIKIIDIATTIFQAFLIVWSCNNIALKNKLSKLRSVFLAASIIAIIVAFTYSSFKAQYANLLMVFATFLTVVIFYRKSVVDAIIGFGFSYGAIIIAAYFIMSFNQIILPKLNLHISPDLQALFFIYIPGWIIYSLIYLSGKYIFNAFITLKSFKNSYIFALIILYSLIILDTLRVYIQFGSIDLIFKYTFYLLIFMIFIFIVIYFAKINEKSKEVEMLNSALKDKISELKKIKHDYGSEISSLYGLYQLGRIERLGELLKGIVEKNQAVNTSLYVKVQATPIVSSILNPAVSKGIDVIVSDCGEYENLPVTDGELVKVLSNIVNNSIDVLKDVKDPMIRFKSYNNYDGIVITIGNNGAEIPPVIKNKIFETGFSTKNNESGDRGFGLGIVKDIINKYDGHISIESSDTWTQFIIEIPNRK
jgi:hypothetical protein